MAKDKFCTDCGFKLLRTAKFCEECGAKSIVSETTKPETVEEVEEEAENKIKINIPKESESQSFSKEIFLKEILSTHNYLIKCVYVLMISSVTLLFIPLWRIFAVASYNGFTSAQQQKFLKYNSTFISKYDNLDILIIIIFVIVSVFFIFLFVRWLFLFIKLAHEYQLDNLTSPTNVIIWFFVPVLGLFKIYNIFNQIYKSSIYIKNNNSTTYNWQQIEVPFEIKRMWLIYILCVISSYLLGIISPESHIDASTFGWFVWELINVSLIIISNYLFIQEIKKIADNWIHAVNISK